MLKIQAPNFCLNEQVYAYEILLGEYLGLPFEIEVSGGDFIEITKPSKLCHSVKLTLDCSFFEKAYRYWLKPESMPVLP